MLALSLSAGILKAWEAEKSSGSGRKVLSK